MPEAVEIIHDDRSAMLLPSTDPRRLAVQARAERLQAESAAAEAARVAARQAQPVRSSEDCRAALAQAITARIKIGAALAKAHATQSQATLNEKTARERLAACEAAAAKAKAEHIARAEEAAKAGKALPSPGAMRATNIEVADATEQLEAARAAVANIAERVPDLEGELRRAQDRVAAGVDDVIRATSVAQLVTQARALQDDLIGRRLGLYYLLKEGLVGDASERKAVADLMHDTALPQAVSINGRVIQATGVQAPAHDGSEAWRAARAALARDRVAGLNSSGARLDWHRGAHHQAPRRVQRGGGPSRGWPRMEK
jgi:hypothetical protein